jgi:cytoskeletal protein CcmA (bactofilin family)/RNase P subunit RPR2
VKITPDANSKPSRTAGRTVPLICPHCQFEQQVRPDGISIFCKSCRNSIDIQEILHPKVKQAKQTQKTVSVTCPDCQHEQQIRPDVLSTFCKKCHNSMDVQKVLHPKAAGGKKTTKTIAIICPDCQHEQQVQPGGVSIFCKKCHNPIDIQKVLHQPAAPAETKVAEGITITCFKCPTELHAPLKAQGVMCKKCGYRNDLQSYHVKDILSRDLETHGTLTIPAGGTVLNSTARVGVATIQGKFIGKLTAKEIILKSGSIFEGNIKADHLVLESNVQCTIKKELNANRIAIAGQYHGNITSGQSVELKRTAQFVGKIVTKNLIIEEGAAVMAELRIGEETASQVQEPVIVGKDAK